jgi:hypothetical protein
MASRKLAKKKTLEELIQDFSGAPAKRLPLTQSDSRKRKDDESGKRTKAGAAAVLADRHKAPQFRRWPGK